MIRPKKGNARDRPRHDHPRRARDDAAHAVGRDPWIKGHALGPDRGILIVDIETAGGITGMGYLFHLPPRPEIDRGIPRGSASSRA